MPARAVCPACDEWVTIPNQPKLGHRVTSRYCETELEVITLNPVELDWTSDDDDDWDTQWDDDDEED